MTVDETYLKLRGLEAPVRLCGTGWSEAGFADFLPRWPFEIARSASRPPFATLDRSSGRFRFTSEFGDGPVDHASLVNTVCDVIAHAARQRTLERPDDMCLHASAVQFGDGLAVFPALRRAGKSTLTAALAAKGHAVFSDDVLPVEARPGAPLVGQATGAAIRLRLPVPATLPGWFHDFVAETGGPWNRQYRYLNCPQLAENGTSLPIKAFIALERMDGEAAALVRVPPEDMLKSLLKQNFAREATADRILLALLALVKAVPGYRLRYSDIDPAAGLLAGTLGELPTVPAIMPAPLAGDPLPGGGVDHDPDRPLVQRPDAMVIDLGGEAFGVSADLCHVLHLDEGTLRLWALLEAPTSENDALAILAAAFPEAPGDRVRSDTGRVFRKLRNTGLVTAV